MIVVLKNGLTQAQSQDFIAYLEAQNVKTVPIVGSENYSSSLQTAIANSSKDS